MAASTSCPTLAAGTRRDRQAHQSPPAGCHGFQHLRVLGVDYSVPPAFVGRRVAIRVSPTTVRLSCEAHHIALRARSFVPADVVLAPAHGRAIRLAREARDRLRAGEPQLPPIDLGRYDALFEVPA